MGGFDGLLILRKKPDMNQVLVFTCAESQMYFNQVMHLLNFHGFLTELSPSTTIC